MSEIINALIESASISTKDGFLTVRFQLDYGDCHHRIECHHNLKSITSAGYFIIECHHRLKSITSAGYFICDVLKIAGVDSWDKLPGKAIRVRMNSEKIEAVGHIIKNDWLNFD